MFTAPAAQAVFAEYEARAAADVARMKELGPAGYAVRDAFLLPVGAEAGRLLHALILGAKPHTIVEVGTSYGYSTLFLADRRTGIACSIGSNLELGVGTAAMLHVAAALPAIDSIRFPGDIAESVSGTTNSSGVVVLTSTASTKKLSFSTCVLSLSVPGLTAAPSGFDC